VQDRTMLLVRQFRTDWAGEDAGQKPPWDKDRDRIRGGELES